MDDKRVETSPKTRAGTRKVPVTLPPRRYLVALRGTSADPDAYVLGERDGRAFAPSGLLAASAASAYVGVAVVPHTMSASEFHPHDVAQMSLMDAVPMPSAVAVVAWRKRQRSADGRGGLDFCEPESVRQRPHPVRADRRKRRRRRGHWPR